MKLLRARLHRIEARVPTRPKPPIPVFEVRGGVKTLIGCWPVGNSDIREIEIICPTELLQNGTTDLRTNRIYHKSVNGVF